MGIKFKGTHSDSIPATWKTISRPFLPPAKNLTDSASDMDGTYDFSEVNEDGRIHYDDRVFEGTLTVTASNIANLQIVLTKLAKWIVGGFGELIFDDMPETIWIAKIENADKIAYELGKVGIASIYFRVKPFSKAIASAEDSFEFAAHSMISVDNLGDWYTKPVITITGTFGYVEIVTPKKTIRYNGGCAPGSTIIIDCSKIIITKNGVNDSANSVGNYFELTPGTNVITINSDGTGTAVFSFDYNFINGGR